MAGFGKGGVGWLKKTWVWEEGGVGLDGFGKGGVGCLTKSWVGKGEIGVSGQEWAVGSEGVTNNSRGIQEGKLSEDR